MLSRIPVGKNSDNGYLEAENTTLIQATVAMLRMHEGKTDFEWVKAIKGTLEMKKPID